jgi:lysophospholipase L1-like esterase
MKRLLLAFALLTLTASAAEPLKARRIVFLGSSVTLSGTSSMSWPHLYAKRVVFLGDSITYGGQYVVDFSCWLAATHPSIEVLNLGLASETVSGLSEDGHAGGKFPRPDLHERLDRVLKATKPHLVIACYGMNDGIYLPLDEERFKKFRDGMTRLHEAVRKTSPHIIHLTPAAYDARGEKPYYDDVLARYSAWLLDQRASGWQVVDIHGWMNKRLAELRRNNPDFTFSRDHVHPDKAGHRVMAQPLLAYFGGTETAADNTELRKLVEKRMVLLRNAWLTATGHKRPGVAPGLPLPEAEKQAAELTKQINALLAK